MVTMAAGCARTPVNRPLTLPTWTAPLRAPKAVYIPTPEFDGSNSIFGAVGRDSRGHIWFGISAKGVETPSAHLFEFDPATGKMTDRGDVVSALKSTGVYRDGDQQMKIHSRIVQADDGHIYFASMDEEGEEVEPEVLPTWGGHLWRLRLPERKWEHLARTPEALIAAAEGGRWVYALGYWGHVLYQYDCKTGKVRKVKVGAFDGHVSRNILADPRGHVYVPRVTPGANGDGAEAVLIEYDENLKEVAQLPLAHYLKGSPGKSQGITGFVKLPGGAIAFLTQYGHVALLRPSATGPATIKNIGWLHPRGRSATHSLFTDSTGQYLMGAAKRGKRYQWVVYDLKTRQGRTFPFRIGLEDPKSHRRDLYGTAVRDNAGACYLVGGNSGRNPIVVQVRP